LRQRRPESILACDIERARACESAQSYIQPLYSHSRMAPASFSTEIAQPCDVRIAVRPSLDISIRNRFCERESLRPRLVPTANTGLGFRNQRSGFFQVFRAKGRPPLFREEARRYHSQVDFAQRGARPDPARGNVSMKFVAIILTAVFWFGAAEAQERAIAVASTTSTEQSGAFRLPAATVLEGRGHQRESGRGWHRSGARHRAAG